VSEHPSSNEQVRPKWYVKARERMALMKRFATGTDVHLLEMACTDYDAHVTEIENLRLDIEQHYQENGTVAKHRFETVCAERDRLQRDVHLLEIVGREKEKRIAELKQDIERATANHAADIAAHEPCALPPQSPVGATPETENEAFYITNGHGRIEVVRADFARRLEASVRELRRTAQQPACGHVGNVQIPTATMEQEFQTHYRRGYEAGKRAAQQPPAALQRRAEYAERFHTVLQLAVTHLGKFAPIDFKDQRKGEFVAAVYSAAESALNGAGEIPELIKPAQPSGDAHSGLCQYRIAVEKLADEVPCNCKERP
jgi:hypothetical protein